MSHDQHLETGTLALRPGRRGSHLRAPWRMIRSGRATRAAA